MKVERYINIEYNSKSSEVIFNTMPIKDNGNIGFSLGPMTCLSTFSLPNYSTKYGYCLNEYDLILINMAFYSHDVYSIFFISGHVLRGHLLV